MPDRVPVSSEPRPENPYRTVHARMSPPGAAWDEGFASRQPEIDRLEAERDEMIRVSAANIATTQRNMDAARAERDAALAAGQKLADEVDRALKATENSGTAQRHLIRSIEALGILEPALAAFRSVSGSSEPR